MVTDWKWRLFLIVPVSANSAENRTAFAEAFSLNGSGQTTQEERGMFNSVVPLSATGLDPATHFGIDTAVKAAMRTDLDTLIDSINTPVDIASAVAIANVDLPGGTSEGGYLAKRGLITVSVAIGEAYSFDDMLADLLLQKIEPAEI